MLPYAQAVHRHVITVHNMMQDIFTDTGNLNNVGVGVKNFFINSASLAGNIRNNITSMATHNSTDFFSILNIILPILFQAKAEVRILLPLQVTQQDKAGLLKGKHDNFTHSFSLIQIRVLQNLLPLFMNRCSIIHNATVEQQAAIHHSLVQISFLRALLSSGEIIIAEVESLLFLAQNDIATLNLLNFASTLDESSGSGSATLSSDSGSGSFMSGLGELTGMTLDMNNFTSVGDGLQIMWHAIHNLQTTFLHQQDYLIAAIDTTRFLNFAELLNM